MGSLYTIALLALCGIGVLVHSHILQQLCKNKRTILIKQRLTIQKLISKQEKSVNWLETTCHMKLPDLPDESDELDLIPPTTPPPPPPPSQDPIIEPTLPTIIDPPTIIPDTDRVVIYEPGRIEQLIVYPTPPANPIYPTQQSYSGYTEYPYDPRYERNFIITYPTVQTQFPPVGSFYPVDPVYPDNTNVNQVTKVSWTQEWTFKSNVEIELDALKTTVSRWPLLVAGCPGLD